MLTTAARRRLAGALGAAMVCALAACSASNSTPPVQRTPAPVSSGLGAPSFDNVLRVSTDPFTNSQSQHATEVEPSAASAGTSIVVAFQAGRFFGHGASDIGFATSLDGGVSWQSGTLPGTTRYAIPAGPYDSISDPSVGYDARHATWLIAGLPISSNGAVPGVVVSRSPDGMTWSAPIAVTAANETNNDKNWIACDDRAASPFYGHCYIEWDDFSGSGKVLMSTSADGGITWSATASPPTTDGGIGGQPVVQPNGTVIVPMDNLNATRIESFRSTDGGVSWQAPVTVATIADHAEQYLRAPPLVSASIDLAGTVYAVWQDCRFRANCAENDLVLSTSPDGASWTTPARIPLDVVSSTADHFIPGVAVDPNTGGGAAHVGVAYYSYSDASCTASTCMLSGNFVASPDGGASWTPPQLLAGPMSNTWLAATLDGPMVGDYAAAAFVSGNPLAFAALAAPSSGASFNEAMYVSKAAAIAVRSAVMRRSLDHPVPGFHSDHPPHRVRP